MVTERSVRSCRRCCLAQRVARRCVFRVRFGGRRLFAWTQIPASRSLSQDSSMVTERTVTSRDGAPPSDPPGS